MIKRKSYLVSKAGSLHNLKISEEILNKPAAEEVSIAVKAIGLNYADLFAIMGLYSATPKGAFIPGLEFSGEIIAVGTEVKAYKIGDKVMGVTRFGGYASHLNINHNYIRILPEGWSFGEGAAFPVQVLTAYYALISLGNLQRGQTVLIHSAAGGVGILANRIAKKYNAYTIGVVGHESKLDILKAEGYDQGIVRNKIFKKNVTESLAGRELNLVLETTGNKYAQWSYDLLAPQGRMICYGSAQFTPSGSKPFYPVLLWKYLFRPRFDPLTMITTNKSVMAFNLIWLYEKAELFSQMMEEVMKLELSPPLIGYNCQFKQLPEALHLFLGGKTVGKVIVHVE